MTLSTTDLDKVAAALDVRRYRRTQEKKYPETKYAKLVDKFFANKPVTLPELNETCESEESCWAYVSSLLRIFPAHAALALEGKWNGQTMANGMVLAHAVTRATVFLPLDAFVFVFATLLRHADEGGISFAQVAKSPAGLRELDDKWVEVFTGWIGDVIGSRERTLDLAMHTAGVRFFSIGSALMQSADAGNKTKDDLACIGITKELLLGELTLDRSPKKPRQRPVLESGMRS